MGIWQKSSFSGNGPDNDCVEIALRGHSIALRESEEPDVVVTTAPGLFGAFIRNVKNGEYDHLG